MRLIIEIIIEGKETAASQIMVQMQGIIFRKTLSVTENQCHNGITFRRLILNLFSTVLITLSLSSWEYAVSL